MTLLQLLDWLMFVKTAKTNVDWVKVYTFLREQKLDIFANALNAIGVKCIGFLKFLFFVVSTDDKLVSRILGDILSPEFADKDDGSLLNALWVKSRRFLQKHKLCYKDSFWTGF